MLPEPLAGLLLACSMGLNSGQAELPVLGGEAGGGFPDEVGDLAMDGQALQGWVIHVGTDLKTMVGASQAKWSRCRRARRWLCSRTWAG
jgi:hypothetical protein